MGPGTISTPLTYTGAEHVQFGVFDHGGFESEVGLTVKICILDINVIAVFGYGNDLHSIDATKC